MSGHVDTTTKSVDHIGGVDETVGGECGEVADARVRVFDGEIDAFVVRHRQRQGQRRNQLETSTEMIEFADLCQ